MTIQIRLLETDADFDAIYPFIEKLNDGMSHQEFRFVLEEMRKRDYGCAGAYAEDGTCVGICGFWIEYKFWCRKAICLDHLMVSEHMRGAGIGAKLMEFCIAIGREQNCKLALLDTYVDNYKSHKLYMREGMEIWGYHFVKEL
ncbi:MAG: GNAT family N-acetyltransferase [Rickettsiales bacterium]